MKRMAKGDNLAVIIERLDGLQKVFDVKLDNICKRMDDVCDTFADHDKRDIERYDLVMARLSELDQKAAVNKAKLATMTTGLATIFSLIISSALDRLNGK